MTIEKLPSGSYRIKQMHNGKMYHTTIPYKPSKAEATILIGRVLDEHAAETQQNAQNGTFDYFVNKYLNEKKKVLSPSTIVNYRSVQRNLSDSFKSKMLMEITEADIQQEIDSYSIDRSPKTVKNAYGLIRSVFAEFRPKLNLSISLPKSKQKVVYEPTTRDVERIMEAAEGTCYDIPIALACLGLRRGEILALTIDDLDNNNVLTIDKAVAITEDKTYIVKGTKTEESKRRIPIPSALAEKIRKRGYIYNGAPGQINKYLHVIQRKLDIPEFNLHLLRHFSAAYLHKAGFTEEQIMAWCGWSTSDTMKRVYRYNLDPAETQKDMADTFGSFFG